MRTVLKNFTPCSKDITAISMHLGGEGKGCKQINTVNPMGPSKPQ